MMKIQTLHYHPDALMNYLVTTSIVKREMFFLGCELNNLYSLILDDADLSEWMANYRENSCDYMMILSCISRESLGVRGFLYDLIVDCEWDIEEFIYMYRKQLGKV
jgi:hypothetical protein